MANVRIDPQQLSDSGVTPSDHALTSSDTYLISNDGKVFLEVENSTGGSLNVIFATLGSVGGFSVTDNTQAVGAGAKKVFGPFAPRTYHPSGTDLQVTVSGNLTARVYRL